MQKLIVLQLHLHITRMLHYQHDIYRQITKVDMSGELPPNLCFDPLLIIFLQRYR